MAPNSPSSIRERTRASRTHVVIRTLSVVGAPPLAMFVLLRYADARRADFSEIRHGQETAGRPGFGSRRWPLCNDRVLGSFWRTIASMTEFEIVIVPAGGHRQADIFATYWGDILLATSRTPFFDSARQLLELGAEPNDLLITRHRNSSTTSLASAYYKVADIR